MKEKSLPSALLRIPLPDSRQQVLVERAGEVEGRLETPVAARGRIIDVRRPGIDDTLALFIDAVRDRRTRKRLDDDVADLGGRQVEGAQVISRARETLDGGRCQYQQCLDAVRHRHEGNGRVWPDKADIRLPF